MTPEAMLKHPWDMAVDYVGGFSDVEAGRPLVNVKPNSQSNVQAVFNHSIRESLV